MNDNITYEEESKPSYSTPDRLRQLMKQISVQVLKGQPKEDDLYMFIANYLHAQLRTRDSDEFSGHGQEIVRDVMENDLTYNAMLARWGISMGQANHAATIIQATFRGFQTRHKNKETHALKEDEECVADKLPHKPAKAIRNLEWEKVNSAATVIQRKFRSMTAKAKKENPPGEPQKRPRIRTINTTQVTETSGVQEENSTRLSEELDTQNTICTQSVLQEETGNNLHIKRVDNKDDDERVRGNDKTENVTEESIKNELCLEKLSTLEGNTEEKLSNLNESIDTSSSDDLFKIINHAV